MSEVVNIFNYFGNLPSESEELKIDESVKKYCIDLLKDRFRSERERGVVATCLGDGYSTDKNALYDSDMSRGRNKCPRRAFLISGEILGCAIYLVDVAQ